MTTPLVIDLTRLFVSILRGRPRGIERVDLDFAAAMLSDRRRPVFGIIAYPWGPRVLDRGTVEQLVAALRQVWAEDAPLESDSIYSGIRGWLTGNAEKPSRYRRMRHLPRDVARIVARTGLRRGKRVQTLPAGTIYLNIGQVGFAVDRATHWLSERSDIRVVSFLHDLLPLDEPEWFAKGSDTYFEKVLARMLGRSECVIVSTEDMARRLSNHAHDHGRGTLKILVQPLVPTPALAYRTPFDPELGQVPYLIMCGTIEARKNHAFILQLWRESLLRGRQMPKLVVAGSRGWGAAEAFDLLDRCSRLKGHVREANGLSSQAMMHLLAHSRGLLAPSHAEGFGLPVVEALTLKVPVIASDIPAFREASQGYARLIDNADGPSWDRAIGEIIGSAPQTNPSFFEGFRPASPENLVEAIASLDQQ